jgi:hypothetical protein
MNLETEVAPIGAPHMHCSQLCEQSQAHCQKQEPQRKSAHIKYLEWFCIGQAQEAGRYALDNGNAGQEPHVTEPMLADIMDAYAQELGAVGGPRQDSASLQDTGSVDEP